MNSRIPNCQLILKTILKKEKKKKTSYRFDNTLDTRDFPTRRPHAQPRAPAQPAATRVSVGSSRTAELAARLVLEVMRAKHVPHHDRIPDCDISRATSRVTLASRQHLSPQRQTTTPAQEGVYRPTV